MRKPCAGRAAHRTRSTRLNTYRDFIEVPVAEREKGVKSKFLRERVIMLPVKALPLRVAKFDVVLRERPLQAVRAKQTMLSRMVLFTCNPCRERFQRFTRRSSRPGT